MRLKTITSPRPLHVHPASSPAVYSCALLRDILLQGRLYISRNWLCFYANLFGKDIKVSGPTDITNVCHCNAHQRSCLSGVYTCGVNAAGKETQDGRVGAQRPGHHHGHRPEGASTSCWPLCFPRILCFPIILPVSVCLPVCSTSSCHCCPGKVSTTSCGGSALTCRLASEPYASDRKWRAEYFLLMMAPPVPLFAGEREEFECEAVPG